MPLDTCCRNARAGKARAIALAVLASAACLTGARAGATPAPVPYSTLPPARILERVAVFGTDERVPLPPKLRGLEASIGLLYEARSHSVCSAFCVDDAIVATAAHCLFRTSGERPPRLGDFTFRLPSRNQATRTWTTSRIAGAEVGSAAQHVVAGSTRLSIHPPIDATRDWALVRLTRPMCKGARLTISRRSAKDLLKLSAAQRLYHVAFHRDFGNWRLAYGAPCAVRRVYGAAGWNVISRDFSDAEQLILHTCDTGGASSGSPLLMDGPAGPEVVGMNVGTYVQSRVLMQDGEVVHRYQADTVANTGVSTAAFLEKLEAFTGADILATRAKMRELQSLLAARGLYRGTRDGAYGPLVRQAIERFERAQGRPETGLATAALLRRLAVLKAEGHAPPDAGHDRRLETGSLASHRATKGQGPEPGR